MVSDVDVALVIHRDTHGGCELEAGRATRPDLEVGICGEHGGDPKSVAFCHKIGQNYVSCSPFRVPIARLAAAHAAIAEKEAKK